MVGLVWETSNYLCGRSDSKLFEAVSAPPQVPVRRSSLDKEVILSGFIPSENMDWSQYAQQEDLVPLPQEEHQKSGSQSLLS